ncbi:FG-GAP-like repeat-containing protein [Desulfoglaeba alkanexedens]|uniref:VCBS repeat-containing protein n=1 Tax=Desulfoglaeba alkanexedens ALDC TaxID=980445 RepID=A0A4P8L2V5_9BACT|nr:FG-GAP-like repeat-containing protein [Desulfoglaeba alkanexedens]QCQ21295.1 hypothetical protein FDQ92_03300 [Desulfoglaeba alkanexedens ALDC]
MRNNHGFIPFLFLAMLVLFGSFRQAPHVQAAEPEDPVRVAILPFSMHTPPDLSYLQDGIWEMLASRLAWEGKVQVVPKSQIQNTLGSLSGDLSQDAALNIGRSLEADYVLFGSVTALGQAVSLDAKMAGTEPGAEPLSFHTQSGTLDQLIPAVSNFAQDINRKLFGRAPAAVAAATVDTSPSNVNPESLIPDMMLQGASISYLNPNFVEVNPDEALTGQGLWRSQTFKETIISIDVGDLDGDGSQELVTASPDRLAVYRRVAQGLQLVLEHRADKMERFVWVSTVDLDGDGRDEVVLTNMRTVNSPQASSEKVSGRQHTEEFPASKVFSLQGTALKTLADRQPFYLNAVHIPKRGKILLGQKPGPNTELFDPEIYHIQLRGSELVPIAPFHLPQHCNVFNFVVADINGDGSDETAFISSDNRLVLLDSAGSPIWRSRQRFGATTNVLAGKVTDLRYNQIDYFYVPTRILVTDLNRDAIPELVVNRSPDYSAFLPQGFKYFEAGEIVSYSWDQLGMVENWKTREMQGMLTSLALGDLNDDGTPELIASLVTGQDLTKLWESKSTIFSYDLNVKRAEKTAQKP